MTDRLLTERERDEALRPYWSPVEPCEKCGKVSGGIYLLSPSERDRLISQAQDAKTLKEVSEWTEDNGVKESGDGYLYLRLDFYSWQAFLRGEFPEEVKP